MRQFTDNNPGILGKHYYQCCSSHPTHSRRQYRDYIIDLYGVKNSTMSYSKCKMLSLSCLLSFYTIPKSLLFNSKNFFYFLVYIAGIQSRSVQTEKYTTLTNNKMIIVKVERKESLRHGAAIANLLGKLAYAESACVLSAEDMADHMYGRERSISVRERF